MNPLIAAALISAVLTFCATWKVQDWRHDAAEKERIEQENETRRQQARTADKASEEHETVKEQIRTEFKIIYRDVDHVVEKPVYRNVCLDDDGLQLIARAIGKPGPAASEPAPAVPGPDGAR